MNNGNHIKLVFTLSLLLSGAANAAPINLSLTTSGDPAHMQIGDTLTVSVEASGLATGEELDSLAATVVFDGSLLSSPSISMGSIVPNPLDNALDLLVTENSGQADVAFLTFGTVSADLITENGVFYSFDVTAENEGSGSISFSFVDATQFNVAAPDSPLAISSSGGPSIEFEVVTIPEPSTAVLALALCVGFQLSRRREHPNFLFNRNTWL